MTSQYNLDMALLSMHAYNTSNSARHINGLTNSLGNYEYVIDDESPNGFSATAFRGSSASSAAGQIIVSIRGTNPKEFWNDADNGFLLGIGVPGQYSPQSTSALAFYQSLVDTSQGDSIYSNNIILTGHSLGGGLAGYVAALYGKTATIFDNMAYSGAARSDHKFSIDYPNSQTSSQIYLDLNDRAVDVTGITSFATTGEIVAVNRGLSYDPPTQYIDSFAGATDPVSLHSMALQVNLQWAALNLDEIKWSGAAPELWSAYLGESVAGTMEEAKNKAGSDGDAGTVLREAIAYSAIAEGEKPFGDTAIHAMFNDTENLTQGLGMNPAAPTLSAMKDVVGEVIVEYAGRLALGKVLHVNDGLARDGIIQTDAGVSTLSIDFAPDRWTFAGVKHDSAFKSDLINRAIVTSNVYSDFYGAMSEYVALAGSPAGEVIDLINSVSFQIDATPKSIEVAGGDLNLLFLQSTNGSILLSEGSGGARDRVVIGSEDADVVTGGSAREVMVGGDGADVLHGAEGDDVLFGGAGDDTLVGGAGSNTIDGGDDVDTVSYADETEKVRLVYGMADAAGSLDVTHSSEKTDTLTKVEVVTGTPHQDILKIEGSIRYDENLTIDAGDDSGSGGQDIINGAGLAPGGGLRISINAAGIGTIIDKASGGVIHLKNFHTQVVASDDDDTIDDVMSGEKHIDGGAGDDAISVGGLAGSSILLGGVGNDEITGGDHNDIIHGGQGKSSRGENDYQIDNTLKGGAGSDLIISDGHLDHVFGGSGSDYVLARGFGWVYDIDRALRINGGEGNDVVDLREMPVFGGAEIVLSTDSGNDTVLGYFPRFVANMAPYDTLVRQRADIVLDGVSEDDIVVIWNTDYLQSSEYYEGTGDLAIVVKSTGASILIKNVYGDYSPSSGRLSFHEVTLNHSDFFYMTGASYASGEREYTGILDLADGSVAQYEGAIDEYKDATSQPSSTSSGTSGGDNLTGGMGADTIDGGAGDDNFDATPGGDTYTGGEGTDTVTIFGRKGDFEEKRNAGEDFSLTDKRGIFGTILLSSIEKVHFIGDDQTYTKEDVVGYYGTENSDVLTGTDLDNRFFGLAGDDQIVVGDGADVVDGGAGDDVVRLSGSLQASTVFRDPDGTVRAWVPGRSAELVLTDVERLEFALGGAVLRLLELPSLGTSGADVIAGSSRADRLYGGDGNDSLSGAEGDDVLFGEDGDDTLLASGGTDELIGGLGSDTYVVQEVGSASTHATIVDYGDSSETDRLVLSGKASEYVFTSSGYDLVISRGMPEQSITIRSQIAGYGVDAISFGDGYEVQRSSVLDLLSSTTIHGTVADDQISGSSMRDLIFGGGGDDMLELSAGHDVFHWNIGDGRDSIVNGSEADGFDTLLFGGDIQEHDVQVESDSSRSYFLFKLPDGGSVRVDSSWFNEPVIDQVVFSNGITWSSGEIMSRVVTVGGFPGWEPGDWEPINGSVSGTLEWEQGTYIIHSTEFVYL